MTNNPQWNLLNALEYTTCFIKLYLPEKLLSTRSHLAK